MGGLPRTFTFWGDTINMYKYDFWPIRWMTMSSCPAFSSQSAAMACVNTPKSPVIRKRPLYCRREHMMIRQ